MRALVAWSVLVSSMSFAQAVDTGAQFISVNRSESTLALPTARLLERGAWEIALGYRHDGDVLRANVPTGDLRGGALSTQVRWIDQRDVAWVQLAASPLARLELDAALPVLLTQSVNHVGGAATPSGGAALGDARFGARVALLEPKAFAVQGMLWVLQGGVTAPTGSKTAAFGETYTRVDASTTATFQTGMGGAVSAHAGWALGQTLLVGDQLLGDHFTGGASYLHRFGPFQASIDVVTNVTTGAVQMQSPARATLELVAGARYVSKTFFADLAVGAAPIDSGATPRWFAQVAVGARGAFFDAVATVAAVPLDADGDGVLGEADRCPSQPEDFDGFQDDDGCPEHDNDKDTVADQNDRCPNLAEDLDGVADSDGCPETDADGDAVLDENDKCPLAPEDFDGFEDEDGCPEAGSVDGRIRHQAIALEATTISFALGSAVLDENAQYAVRGVARTLLATTATLTVVGHADEQGPDARNDALSLERAEAVKKLLVEAGVSTARLLTRATGKREPVSPGEGFGRTLNRSVTFAWQ